MHIVFIFYLLFSGEYLWAWAGVDRGASSGNVHSKLVGPSDGRKESYCTGERKFLPHTVDWFLNWFWIFHHLDTAFPMFYVSVTHGKVETKPNGAKNNTLSFRCVQMFQWNFLVPVESSVLFEEGPFVPIELFSTPPQTKWLWLRNVSKSPSLPPQLPFNPLIDQILRRTQQFLLPLLFPQHISPVAVQNDLFYLLLYSPIP